MATQMVIGCSDNKGADSGAAEKAVATGTSAEQVPAPTADSADAKLVVVFGDSLYAGYNLGADEGFAPSLEKALTAAGIKARVHNAGVSGDTTSAGRARLAFTLDGLARKPDLLIVGLGGNDMLRGLPVADARANLDAICAELAKRGIPFMLTGMLASPNMGPDYAGAFNRMFPDLAKAYDVPLYPFFLDGVVANPALLLPDGIHPNAQGVSVITDKVDDMVVAALKS